MKTVCAPAPQLAKLVPYDPKYLPAEIYVSANENPNDVPEDLRELIAQEVSRVAFNRYPDPLANELRDMIAEANGLSRDWVLVGNGGDELLFGTALAWGGVGRTFVNMPPTFSVYANNAVLTNTEIVDIPRIACADDSFAIDEDGVFDYIASGKPMHYTIITSPNNPTGLCANTDFIEKLLGSSDALIMVDEAYSEFSKKTVLPLLKNNKNLVILRTFSKAYSLAGVRVGYILAHPDVIKEYIKVRQPYSVDVISQAIARVVFSNRHTFDAGIELIISERERMLKELAEIPCVNVYPSQSNWVLFNISDAANVWSQLYDKGILVRDFSGTQDMPNCLRVSVGTPEQNNKFLSVLREILLSLQK